MYTLHMLWSFRVLVWGVLLTIAVGPQLACFMPDQTVTQSDMDCCKEMIGACTAPNASSGCCQVTAPTELGLAAKALCHVMPRFDLAGNSIASGPDSLLPIIEHLFQYTGHAPPEIYSQSSTVLRI